MSQHNMIINTSLFCLIDLSFIIVRLLNYVTTYAFNCKNARC